MTRAKQTPGLPIFCSLALLSACVAWADYQTSPLTPDAQSRVAERRQQEHEKFEQTIAQRDKLYSEITSVPRPSRLPEHGWTAAGAGLLLCAAFMAGYLLYRFWRRASRRRRRHASSAVQGELIDRSGRAIDGSSGAAPHGLDHLTTVLGLLDSAPRRRRSRRRSRHSDVR